ncbi:MAG: ABC transporter permease subunit [Phycisphaerales bacterium]|nr:ABC transporter permease subunit [Phycisphaerales bacterium]MCI0629585.1 ABC transporter permease subunit [Phycisphaerales bacterium]MCI0677239.1 ABC transporter permease subunit [Phycisphaerales bacterium]
MNSGVIIKTAREIWVPTLMFGIGLLLSEILLAFVLPSVEKDFGGIISQFKLFQTLLKALLGTDIGDKVGPEALQAIAWVDPVVLALVWAHVIVVCTRMPSGEIDRGTADVLFGLPISRFNVYLSDTLVCLIAGAVVIALAWLGSVIGGLIAPTSFQTSASRVFIVLVNLYLLGAAVGGLAYLMSALSDRRGRAIGAVFAIVLASFLLNFLAQFWPPAENVSFLGILNYYRPINPLREGLWPVRDLLVLAGVAFVSWLAGAIILIRRDIATT